MSQAGSKTTKAVDLLDYQWGAFAGPIMRNYVEGQGEKDKIAADHRAEAIARSGKPTKNEVVNFETRAQLADRRAAAAGATRSDNDADLLGYTSPVKRRSASRTLLG